jgi:hypothetical protein
MIGSRTRRTSGAVAVAATLALAFVSSACGLGEKEDLADRVLAASSTAIQRNTVKGSITVTMRLDDAPMKTPALGMAAPPVSSPFVADLGARRSRLDGPQLVHDGFIVHLHRADAKENDARPWLSLDVRDLGDSAGLPFSVTRPLVPPASVFTIPPVVLLDLMAGALTGSLESRGTEDIDGVSTQVYEANFDVEKTVSDTREDAYDARRVDAVDAAYDTLAIKERVHSGRLWIAPDGAPRRFELTLIQAPRNKWAFAATVTVDLLEWGVPVDIALPTADQTIRIASISRLVGELGRSLGVPEAAPALGLPPAQQPSNEAPAP